MSSLSMDPEDLPAFLNKIHTTEQSHVDILQLVSSQSVVIKATLDDDEIEKELSKVNTSVVKPLIDVPALASTRGPFFLL